MAVLSEKVLWPVVAIFIFGVLAGFYIDDRRRLMQEDATTDKQASKEHGGQAANQEHGGETAKSKNEHKEHAGKAAQQASSSNATSNTSGHSSSSMSMDDYLAQSSNERSEELMANAAHHQGFSGGIDEYLTGNFSKPANSMQNKKATNNSSAQTQQSHGATSMSMEEYQAQSNNQSHAQSNSQDAYHGDIDGYLAKYADGKQTPINKQTSEPFNTKEHMGFHGSYEEYAKKYN